MRKIINNLFFVILRHCIVTLFLICSIALFKPVNSADIDGLGRCTLKSVKNVSEMIENCSPPSTHELIISSQLDSIPSAIFDQYSVIHYLDVQSTQLRSLESAMFNKLRKLKTFNAQNNSLTKLPTRIFVNSVSMLTLTFAKNRIEDLLADTFTGLIALISLDLSENKIATMDDTVFKPLIMLKTLRLNQNLLKVIDVDVFRSSHKLKTLYLSENSISNIQPESFHGLRELMTLEIGNNTYMNSIDLTQIPKLRDVDVNDAALTMLTIPANVSKINAKNNKIVVIRAEPNAMVNSLDLRNNSIHNLHQFANFTNLQYLDLSLNNITEVDFSCFKNLTALEKLIVAENPVLFLNATTLLKNMPALEIIELSAEHFEPQILRQFVYEIKKSGRRISIFSSNSSNIPGGIDNVMPDEPSTSVRPDAVSPTTTDSSANNKNILINDLIKRIDKLEMVITAKDQENKVNSSTVQHNELEKNVADLRLIVIWMIIAFSVFVSFQIAMFVRQNYKRIRLPINGLTRNGLYHGRPRSHESVSPILEEVL